MFTTYRPCSFFPEPIITSSGVIFGLETNGSYITGQLPYEIQRSYVYHNDVPIADPSHFNDSPQRYQSNNIAQKAITNSSSSNPAISNPAISNPAISKSVISKSVYDDRYEEVALEIAIMKKTGLDTKFAKDHTEYMEICTKIFDLVKVAKKDGIESITYKYVPVSPIGPPPTSSATKSSASSSASSSSASSSAYSSASSAYNSASSSIISRKSLQSLGKETLQSRIKRLQSKIGGSSVVSSVVDSENESGSESGNDSESESENQSVSVSKINAATTVKSSLQKDIKYAGCVIIYTGKDGKQSLYLGKNKDKLYSSITENILTNDKGVSESPLVTATKSVTSQFPNTHVIINYDTVYSDIEINDKQTTRAYLIETNKYISTTQLNTTIQSMKDIGFDMNLKKIRRFPIDSINNNLGELANNYILDENNKKYKITDELKQIITTFLESNYF